MRESTASSNLNWRSFGTGPAQMLALHCGLGQGGMWRKAAAPLSDHCTFCAPDLPGHGSSPPFPAGEDVHDVAYEALRPHLTQGMHLAGHSFGGTLALRLAIDAPEWIASLTLIEPVFFAAAADTTLKRDHIAAEDDIFAAYRAGDLMQSARLFNRLWGGGVPWDRFSEKAQLVMAQQMHFICATEPALWQDRAGMLVSGVLERITCPITLLRGSQTVPIVAEIHQGLMGRLPQAREVVVDGASHMLLASHPNDVTTAMGAALGVR